MKDECDSCNVKTENPRPAKFSPEDRMGNYRREAKKDLLIKRGLL